MPVLQSALELLLPVMYDLAHRAVPALRDLVQAVHEVSEGDEVWRVTIATDLVADMRREVLRVVDGPLQRL